MQKIVRTSLLALLICGVAFAKPSAQSPTERRTAPLKSFDVSIIDRSVDPCTDFYQFACGGWRNNNPVPSDKARWGRFDELREVNLWTLRDILDAASKPSPSRTPLEAQVGDFYASCMDQASIDAAGPRRSRTTSRGCRARRRRRSSSARWARPSARAGSLFNFAVGTDLKNSTRRS